MSLKVIVSRVVSEAGVLRVVLLIFLVGFIASVGLEIITPSVNLELDSHHFSSTYIGSGIMLVSVHLTGRSIRAKRKRKAAKQNLHGPQGDH